MNTGGIVVNRDLMVPARDGVMLATDVYRPEGLGPFPVLLERTPYDKTAASRSERTAAKSQTRGQESRSPPISPCTAILSLTRTAVAAIGPAAISQNT
jgi:predicted acyl esterase